MGQKQDRRPGSIRSHGRSELSHSYVIRTRLSIREAASKEHRERFNFPQSAG